MHYFYKASIEYDGTKYHGMQKQNFCNTIQSAIEKVLSTIFDHEIKVIYSGRTDAGVHAINQVINFSSKKHREIFNLKAGLNSLLRKNKDSIVFKEIEKTSKDFHSRFDAKLREYKYKIINREEPLTFYENKYCWVYRDLDVDKMINASKFLLGFHDFTSFRASGCQAKTAKITLHSIEVEQSVNSYGDKVITITVSAPSFLYHMVRNIASALIEVGYGKINPEDIKTILDNKDRSKAPQTAEACGLYLSKIYY